VTGDRLPCLNPRCGRSFKKRQPDEDHDVVCGKCWRLLPVRLTRRHKALRARSRRIGRLARRKRTGIYNTPRQLWRIGLKLDRLWNRNWDEIRAFFRPVDKPEGIDAFLEEVGL
jgi:hypothetical protein